MAGTLRAQEARYAFAVRPHVTDKDLAASRFWTRSTIALVALDGADDVGHAVLLGGATMNGLGAASSIKHRVADW